MKLFIVISALTLVSGQQWGTSVSPCTHTSAHLPVVTEVQDCSIPPCSVNRGESININIAFRVPHDVNSLRTRAIVFFASIPVTLDLGAAGDTCSNLLSGRCPAGQGTMLLHGLNLFIDASAPSISLPIEISIVDENIQAVTCFRMIMRVEHSTQKLVASRVD